jgi:Carboxypeptidase regulatory-like domain
MYRPKRSLLLRSSLAVLLTLLCSQAGKQLSAQVSTASLNGTILDPSGAAVSNAKVIVQNDATGLNRTTETNGSGSFSFDFLPIGTYTLEVSSSGFKGQKQNNILLNTADNQRVDFQLAVASDVTAISVTVNTVELDTVSPHRTSTSARFRLTNSRCRGRIGHLCCNWVLVSPRKVDEDRRPGSRSP